MRSSPAIVALLLLILAPVRSHASCQYPPDQIHWQFPADGATEVPTNVSIWMVLSYRPTLRVTLNGVPLEPASTVGAGRFHWIGHGDLAPLTQYTLAIERIEGEPAWSATTTFTTADGPLAATARPFDVTSLTYESLGPYGGEEWLTLDKACRELVFVQGCYDTGAIGRLTLSTDSFAAGGPAFWTHELEQGSWELGGVWPADCGPLSMLDQRSGSSGGAGSPCRVVSAMDAAGNPMGRQTVCVTTPNVPSEDSSGSDASGGSEDSSGSDASGGSDTSTTPAGEDVGASAAKSTPGCTVGRSGDFGAETAIIMLLMVGAATRTRRAFRRAWSAARRPRQTC